ncbi:MAG: hypothetical protein QM679_10050 [Patulibacter sp.]
MHTYEFTLRFDRDPELHIDALYAAGLSDAAIEVGPAGSSASFDREAPSLWEAVASAVADVQKTPVRVVGIETDALDSLVGLAEDLGVTRQRMGTIAESDGFPLPTQIAGKRRLYSRRAVNEWQIARGKPGFLPPETPEDEAAVRALDAALRARAVRAAVSAERLADVQRLAA